MTSEHRKQPLWQRLPVILGIALIGTMLLLFGRSTFHLPGNTPLPIAHAATTIDKKATGDRPQTPCASQPTQAHCANQDPMVQQCYRDAQTLSFLRVLDQKNRLLAIVQRRYSSTCQSEWGRIIAYNSEPVSIAIGGSAPEASAGPIAFTGMLLVPDLAHLSTITGAVSINGITPGESNSSDLVAILHASSTADQ
jgi:hypothetical protein